MNNNNNIENYKNQVELLKQALDFYGNKLNYTEKKLVNDNWLTKLDIDFGHQARYALEQLKIVEDANEKIIEEYNKYINSTINSIENHEIELNDAIKELKKI